MKQIWLLIALSFLFTNCKQEKSNSKNKKEVDLTITSFDIPNTSIRAIIAENDSTVYYTGSNGQFGFTTDGGQFWSKKTITYNDTLTPEFRSIAKNKEGVFLLSVGNPALLYKVTDSTQTVVYKEVHENVFYDSMHFFDNGVHGIAVGDPTDGCPSIITTSDAGNTWTKISCENLPNFENGEAFFAASNTNIKIINNIVWIASGGKKSRILKSTDKGKTWEIFETPFIQGNGPQGIYSIDFYDENIGIAVGGSYANPTDNCKNKAITNDGGKTWNIVSDNLNPNYKSCVQYIPHSDGKKIIALGKTGISYSEDGGNQWEIMSDASFYTIQFVNQHNAWVAGNNKIGKIIVP
ncbi:WD40/YVTN/BNR-like repeat-containing protein [Tenacibaculum geojense]|uniref:WD40/YVTN/BNR-like repeat-containing protein n=1 Tax=Tenacibaculum geojense TaxID=915352 RepID=A0ABW3JMK6_9FLAO